MKSYGIDSIFIIASAVPMLLHNHHDDSNQNQNRENMTKMDSLYFPVKVGGIW